MLENSNWSLVTSAATNCNLSAPLRLYWVKAQDIEAGACDKIPA